MCNSKIKIIEVKSKRQLFITMIQEEFQYRYSVKLM